jgi:hypothetical protein
MGTSGAAVVQLFGTGLKAYGTYEGIKAAESEAKFRAQVARNNVKIIDQQKKDVRLVGEQLFEQLEREGVEFSAGQVTAFASGGIDISSSVVQEAVEATARVTAKDIVQAQSNLRRELWGLDVEKMGFGTEAIFQEAKAKRLKKLAPVAVATSLLGSFDAGTIAAFSGGGA